MIINHPTPNSVLPSTHSNLTFPSVWRPLNGPVDNWPLAMMDYRSLSASNLHPCTLWRHQHEERGQTVAFSYAEGQEWYYLDGHRREEVTMIKIWDNKEDVVGKREFLAILFLPTQPKKRSKYTDR